MLEKILKHLGYIKELRINEYYLADYYGKLVGDPTDSDITKADEDSFFKDLARVDKARDFFKATMARDMQRYFSAPDQKSRDVIQGAFARTVYFRGKLKEAQEPNKINKTSKLDKASDRYA